MNKSFYELSCKLEKEAGERFEKETNRMIKRTILLWIGCLFVYFFCCCLFIGTIALIILGCLRLFGVI